MSRHFFTLCIAFISLFLLNKNASAQTEVQAWGNITGIRAEDQLFRFESSIRLVYDENWHQERATGRERNWTTYRRNENSQIVRTHMDSLFLEQTVTDIAPKKAHVEIVMDAQKQQELVGAFFHLTLPAKDFSDARIVPLEPAELELSAYKTIPTGDNELMRVQARGLVLKAARQEMEIKADEAVTIIVRKDPETGNLGLYFTLHAGNVTPGLTTTNKFEIAVSGSTDAQVVNLQLFPQYPGNVFLGLGGNFRLQNKKNDPQVIDYSLKNMDVRMGRVEMPWQLWHPDQETDPLEAARSGDIHPDVKAAMEMAQRLYRMNMPVLLAIWFPPQWAAEGTVTRNPRNPDGTLGFPLRQDRMQQIYESITGYIIYLKEAYGVETAMFSFNEADIGINVRQTAREHADFIKGLGAYMKSKGLKTTQLLGDTSDANNYAFLNAALNDPATWEYIGAVSFHSWRGWEKETLEEWYEAADRLNVPLIIGEGSIDAAAWRYPQIFEEVHYAMEEIKLYVRILDICQPLSILQWQLTADYSPMRGGGIFGNDSTQLEPTQRFWNLKQLAATPAGLHILPVKSDTDDIFVTALGDESKGAYVFHIVNEGGEREVVVTGIPSAVKQLNIYTTDQNKAMEQGKAVKVKNGQVQFQVGRASFVSLMSK